MRQINRIRSALLATVLLLGGNHFASAADAPEHRERTIGLRASYSRAFEYEVAVIHRDGTIGYRKKEIGKPLGAETRVDGISTPTTFSESAFAVLGGNRWSTLYDGKRGSVPLGAGATDLATGRDRGAEPAVWEIIGGVIDMSSGLGRAPFDISSNVTNIFATPELSEHLMMIKSDGSLWRVNAIGQRKQYPDLGHLAKASIFVSDDYEEAPDTGVAVRDDGSVMFWHLHKVSLDGTHMDIKLSASLLPTPMSAVALAAVPSPLYMDIIAGSTHTGRGSYGAVDTDGKVWVWAKSIDEYMIPNGDDVLVELWKRIEKLDKRPTTAEGIDKIANLPGYPAISPVDAWGHPFHYKCDESTGNRPHIWSDGPDGRTGTPAGEYVPLQVQGIPPATDIRFCPNAAIVLCKDGTVWAWSVHDKPQKIFDDVKLPPSPAVVALKADRLPAPPTDDAPPVKPESNPGNQQAGDGQASDGAANKPIVLPAGKTFTAKYVIDVDAHGFLSDGQTYSIGMPQETFTTPFGQPERTRNGRSGPELIYSKRGMNAGTSLGKVTNFSFYVTGIGTYANCDCETTKEIHTGSTAADVIKAYGSPRKEADLPAHGNVPAQHEITYARTKFLFGPDGKLTAILMM